MIGGVRRGGRVGGEGCQGGCERRFEVFVIKLFFFLFFFFFFFFWGGGGGWSGWGGGQGGCERRIEVFLKIKKKKLGGGVRGGGRVGGSGWM